MHCIPFLLILYWIFGKIKQKGVVCVVQEIIHQLKLPELLVNRAGKKLETAADWAARRLELLDIMEREVYGYVPAFDGTVSAECTGRDAGAYAGKATVETIQLTAAWAGKAFSFPVVVTRPNAVERPQMIVSLAFRRECPDRYYPQEELVDLGIGVVQVCYTDITSDDGDFHIGAAPLLAPEARTETTVGKIGMWAWAASRVMDYLQTLDYIDKNHIAVLGHSRLGKAALLAGAVDTRFAVVCANDAGCAGDAITRGKQGEHVRDICKQFPYWFCERYQRYMDREQEMPFDQHFLLAAIAPRPVCLGSAAEDIWADPEYQYYACVAAGAAYQFWGMEGFCHPDRLPIPGDCFHDGMVGFHLRSGSHFLSRYDWQQYVSFIKKHCVQ